MSRFTFRFAALLQYRRYRRDLLRSVFAQVLSHKTAVEQQRDEVQKQRLDQLKEMREYTSDGAIDVDAAASRRFHAGQLSQDASQVDRQLQLIDQQLEACRNAVVIAEQDVEVLNRLHSKQRAQHEFEEQKRGQQELDDVWLSAHAGEFVR